MLLLNLSAHKREHTLRGVHILIISLVVSLGVGGYFFYNYWNFNKDLVVWDLVPESAILVYESSQSVEDWNEIQEKEVWDNLEQIPYYASIGSKVEQLDSLSGRTGKLDELLRSKPFVFSVHRVSQSQLDYVFFVSLSDLSDFNLIQTLAKQYQSRDDFRFQERTYQDIIIHEAVNNEYEEVFSYLIHKNYFIGSFTPFLVEDVIRNITDKTKNSFAISNPGLFEVAKLDNDQGNIYINNQRIPQLLSVFTNETISPELLPLGQLAQSTFLDIKVNDYEVLLNGFTMVDPEKNPYLYSVAGSQGNSLDFDQLISNETASLYHLTFANSQVWHQRLQAYWNQHQPQQYQSWEGLTAQYQWNPTELIANQSGGLGMAVLGTVDDEHPDRIIYLRLSDLELGLAQLGELSENLALASGDSAYTESYAGSEIKQISIEQFPSKLWGKLFYGFGQTFYMPIDGYIVLSNSIQGLKALLSAIDADDTWGRSVSKSQFLESSLQESNMSLFVNLNKSWNSLDQQLSPGWKTFFERHQEVLQKFQLLAFQFSDIGDKFYTSSTLTFNPEENNPETTPRFQRIQQQKMESRITSRPFVVKNHNSGGREVLLQDSLNSLYLISNQGRILWQDSLEGEVRGNVSQLDYYKNNKLQYLIATEKNIHIVDRNGNSIQGFPIKVPTRTQLRNVRAIDYDNSKRYRLIASDESGQVFMFDKQGKLLDGWNPKGLDDQLIEAPRHIRIRGKDCIIALQENGLIHIMNRRGNPYPGFPLNLNQSMSGPLYFEQGTDFSKTYFTAVTNQGQIIRFNLNGKIVEKNQLVKPTVDTRYQICVDPLGRHFVIKRQNSNRLGILNKKGEVIFEKDFLTASDLLVQYYLLGNNHSIYAVSDAVQQFTYFYDQDGVLVNASPIESSGEIALIYFENLGQHNIYSVYNNQYALQSF
jgi:hypothetical protein